MYEYLKYSIVTEIRSVDACFKGWSLRELLQRNFGGMIQIDYIIFFN